MPTKPILLVLDDVDHRDQLEALAGSPDWFFPGSLIIFTGKDKQLLRSHKVDEIYNMPFLLDREAYELFCLYAFGKTQHGEAFEELAYQVMKYLQGHPLALKVMGCFLYDKPIRVWKSEVDRLQAYPNAEIQKKLRPSFDGLDFDQKRIFLDISCSFIGEYKDFVANVLDSDDCFADASIEVLVDKSLISISQYDNSLQMHELIRSMAREIVREESNSPGIRSRLWILSDVQNVLNENKATETIEVLDLLREESSQKVHIDGKAFAHMKNLRILKICDKKLVKFRCPFDLKLWKASKVNYSGRLEFLSNKLRLFYWHGCIFKFFPSDFYPENIVAIDLSYSRIENLWTTPKCFRRN
ncbi:hypothetical protein L6452_08056 [Arctium lappa]|uniref:Uncharacterized protein n=1 Tax=Arctium lappa TaxID=4217 RepID=A0ACB9DH14_ARCLA|nr:hypothetical protein L6452_08056 [Arctium lappa]